MIERVDVLVVGAGPTGLALACDLLRRGVRVRIVDAADHSFLGSRAKGLQPRSLEVFDDLEVLADLQRHATAYPLLGIHLGPATVPWKMHRRYKPSEDVPFPSTLLVAQADTEACLRRRLVALGGQVEPAMRFTTYERDAEGLEAFLESSSGDHRVRTRFLVGADGGASSVRKRAGIAFAGATDEADRMIVADLVLDGLARNRWHIWPRTGGRFMALCPLPDGKKFQLMLRLRRGEDADLDEDSIKRRVGDLAGRKRVRVQKVAWASIFRPNVRLAERYRDGDVFLAGDAAHVHTPAGAQGLNTGVQDAYNLAWKLGQVLAGAPEQLLDSYEAERRPVAARVLGLSNELYQDFSRQPLAAARRGDEERQLKLHYRKGPLAAARDDAAAGVHAGDRAPDARYVDAAGASSRLFDAFRGPHFTLLAVGDAAIADVHEDVWPARGDRLRVVRIPSGSACGVCATYGLRTPVQILVRPDGYVAHVAKTDWRSTLAASADAMGGKARHGRDRGIVDTPPRAA
jgi:2-polyprenyl-6-methoxyphenol hydroxylase-like FAD-dependent oxidoreductase